MLQYDCYSQVTVVQASKPVTNSVSIDPSCMGTMTHRQLATSRSYQMDTIKQLSILDSHFRRVVIRTNYVDSLECESTDRTL